MKGRRIIIAVLVMALSITMLPHHVMAKTLKVKNIGTEKIMPLYSDLFLETNIKPEKLRFTSSDEGVAEVTEAGRIKTINPGKTTIRIRQKGSKKKAYKIHLTVRRPNGYTISETGWFFRTPYKIIDVKAAKGYTVYYTTGSKFRTKQKIKSGKTVSIQFSDSTLLKVYAVKKGTKKKVTKAFLNRKNISDRNYGEYYYQYFPPCPVYPPIASPQPSPQPTAADGQQAVTPSNQPEPTITPSGQPELSVMPSEQS
ncbi:MAG: hypothetical protein K2K70_13985 [Lachnospiraceae bacterium]|nr:hypothetical protein [Lachnospiraceae bacterium]